MLASSDLDTSASKAIPDSWVGYQTSSSWNLFLGPLLLSSASSGRAPDFIRPDHRTVASAEKNRGRSARWAQAGPRLSAFCPCSQYKGSQNGATQNRDFLLFPSSSLVGFVPLVRWNRAHNPKVVSSNLPPAIILN